MKMMDDDASSSHHNGSVINTDKLVLGGVSTTTTFLCFYCLFFSLIFFFYIFSSYSSSTSLNLFTPIITAHNTSSATINGFFLRTNQTLEQIKTIEQSSVESETRCDLFDGEWLRDLEGALYSNQTCKTMPLSKNCFFHGRKDTDFLYWRWKPQGLGCELPRFDSKAFLSVVRGKTMAFIGDSLARNHMESLLCLLSLAEKPINTYKDADDKFKTWHFPYHNFTLMVLRSEFLVQATEIHINATFTGGFHLHIDKPDMNWTRNLSAIDIAIFSDGHWFLRPNLLYENGNLIGCVYCKDPKVKDLGPRFAIQRAFKTALGHINQMRKGVVVFVRTFSPAQFEHGAWNEGGYCNRTKGFGKGEIVVGGDDWEFRNVQVEEIGRAKRFAEEMGNKNRFEIIDVTRAMLMRPDGHPGEFWGNKWMKGYSDCIHWCLPGPIDTWNQLLLVMLHKNSNSE